MTDPQLVAMAKMRDLERRVGELESIAGYLFAKVAPAEEIATLKAAMEEIAGNDGSGPL